LSEVSGSGPNGRVLKQDVESFQPKKVEKTQPVVEAPKTATKEAPKKPKKVEIP
jgi:pyruvate/2-oxoglutarate dehydrogenase complex dihydrolipoamide acyltransferase (E2) component